MIRAEPSFGLTTKLFQIPWTYVLLICLLAGVGYAALYSAAGGSPDPYTMKFLRPVSVGDEVSCYCRLGEVGDTSIVRGI